VLKILEIVIAKHENNPLCKQNPEEVAFYFFGVTIDHDIILTRCAGFANLRFLTTDFQPTLRQ
jgi:hypothetical protein